MSELKHNIFVDLDMNDQDIKNALTGIVDIDNYILPTDSVRTAFGKVNGMIKVWTESVTLVDYTNSSNTALQNITELGFNVVAGKKYRIETTLRHKSPAANRGIFVTLGSTNALGSLAANANILHINDGSSALYSGAINSFGDVVGGGSVQAINTDYIVQILGLFNCTQSGLVFPQFRSSANGTTITVTAGSCSLIREF